MILLTNVTPINKFKKKKPTDLSCPILSGISEGGDSQRSQGRPHPPFRRVPGMDSREMGLQIHKDCPALMINVNFWMRPAPIFAMELKNQYKLSLRTKQ